jgi:signal peptidase I
VARSPLEGDVFQTSWPDAPAGAPPPRRSPFAFFRELPVLIVIAFGLALAIKTLLLQAFYIPSASMEPTLHGCPGCSGDRVLVNKLAYRFREPDRGEIVVFVTGQQSAERKSVLRRISDTFTEGLGVTRPKDTDFIKRVIGLPGETIQIKEGAVTIAPAGGGASFRLEEPYLADQRDLSPFGPYTVPEGRYFLMGDNRANSSDSRVNSFGGICPSAPCAVPKGRLVGKAFVRIWPLRRVHVFQVPLYALSGLGLVRIRRRAA